MTCKTLYAIVKEHQASIVCLPYPAGCTGRRSNGHCSRRACGSIRGMGNTERFISRRGTTKDFSDKIAAFYALYLSERGTEVLLPQRDFTLQMALCILDFQDRVALLRPPLAEEAGLQ
ncbi:hypothetical protein DL769_006062 [Monosporascus sp. CRB-8-3]|nr:hypothetical protein DL769_006062 [Monosporascus sp. CRB-8-3]